MASRRAFWAMEKLRLALGAIGCAVMRAESEVGEDLVLFPPSKRSCDQSASTLPFGIRFERFYMGFESDLSRTEDDDSVKRAAEKLHTYGTVARFEGPVRERIGPVEGSEAGMFMRSRREAIGKV